MSSSNGNQVALRTEVDITSVWFGKPLADANYELSDTAKQALAVAVVATDTPVPEQQIINWYAKDLYSRWLNVPAGTLLVGEIHKYEHFFLVIKGSATIANADGTSNTVTAPFMCISPVGARRVIYALEELLIATFHSNVAQCEDIISACTCGSAEEFAAYKAEKGI